MYVCMYVYECVKSLSPCLKKKKHRSEMEMSGVHDTRIINDDIR